MYFENTTFKIGHIFTPRKKEGGEEKKTLNFIHINYAFYSDV